MEQLADFYRGATKRWRIEFSENIAGSAIYFRMARSLSQLAPDIEVAATLDTPDVEGAVFGATLEISAELSLSAPAGDYYAEHQWVTASGDSLPFLNQKIALELGVPRA